MDISKLNKYAEASKDYIESEVKKKSILNQPNNVVVRFLVKLMFLQSFDFIQATINDCQTLFRKANDILSEINSNLTHNKEKEELEQLDSKYISEIKVYLENLINVRGSLSLLLIRNKNVHNSYFINLLLNPQMLSKLFMKRII